MVVWVSDSNRGAWVSLIMSLEVGANPDVLGPTPDSVLRDYFWWCCQRSDGGCLYVRDVYYLWVITL